MGGEDSEFKQAWRGSGMGISEKLLNQIEDEEQFVVCGVMTIGSVFNKEPTYTRPT